MAVMRCGGGSFPKRLPVVVVLLALVACAPSILQTPITPVSTGPLSTEAPRIITIPPEPATPAVGSLDAQKLDRGQTRYETLECSFCHGENGRGTNRGPALFGTTLSQQDFMIILRTGGPLGSAHVYSTSRLSDADGQNLYLYILSFNGGN
jgi:hypothetical protein